MRREWGDHPLEGLHRTKGLPVLGRILALLASAAMALIASGLHPAFSRPWKPTPVSTIRDYATINDTRPGGELVLLIWFVPQWAPANTAGSDILAAMLKKYIVMIVTHGHVERTTGALSFEDIDALQARDQTGKLLTPVARDDLVPTNIAMIAAMESSMRQSLGAMGKGMKMFIFDAGGVEVCEQGQLSVPFANETYTWDTPFPTCPRN